MSGLQPAALSTSTQAHKWRERGRETRAGHKDKGPVVVRGTAKTGKAETHSPGGHAGTGGKGAGFHREADGMTDKDRDTEREAGQRMEKADVRRDRQDRERGGKTDKAREPEK